MGCISDRKACKELYMCRPSSVASQNSIELLVKLAIIADKLLSQSQSCNELKVVANL